MAGNLAASSKDFECPVCHEDFAEPKMLPCTHLACKRCVLALLNRPPETDSSSSSSNVAGCPLCKVPIIVTAACAEPPSGGDEDLDLEALVDSLPTDLAMMTLLESHKVLNSQHVCKVCENGVVASCYCLQCDAKLCRTCSKGHGKLPSLRHHVVEDLSKLTAQRLAASCLSRCRTHEDRPAEVFCSSHYQLVCMLCATTQHKGCPEVKVVGEMAREKRVALKEEVAALREREKALSLQVKEVKDTFKNLRKRVKDTFDDLQQCVKKRRIEMNGLIQAEEDAVMTTVTQWEKTRTAIKVNASAMDQLADTAPDVAFLDMLSKLTGRLTELDQRSRVPSDKGAGRGVVVDVTFESAKLNHLKTAVSSIGRVTTKRASRHVQSAKSTASS